MLLNMYPALLSALLWGVSLCFFGSLGLVYLVISVWLSPRRLHPLAALVCRFTLLTMGQRLSVRGRFPPVCDGPYIYMFNHTSLLDTFITMAIIPEFVGAVGKQEQFEVPIWGHILRRWGVVPIDRAEIDSAIRSLEKAEVAVREGLSLLIAPEGTRSEEGTLGKFKKGPFHVAVNTGASIVPMAISGAFRSKNKNSWILRPGRIEIQVGTTLTPDESGTEQVQALISRTRESFRVMQGS